MSNVAIATRHAEPALEPASRRERHLKALPTPSVRRAPRLVHGVLALAGLAGIVVAQLGLSVLLSEGAYRMTALQGQASQLALAEQSLAEDIAVLSSPQHVAIAADDLGMLAGQPSQFLTLSGAATAGGPDTLHMQAPALDRWGMYVPNALLATQEQTAAAVLEVEAAIDPYPGMLLPVGQGQVAPAPEAAPAPAPPPGTLLPATPGE